MPCRRAGTVLCDVGLCSNVLMISKAWFEHSQDINGLIGRTGAAGDTSVRSVWLKGRDRQAPNESRGRASNSAFVLKSHSGNIPKSPKSKAVSSSVSGLLEFRSCCTLDSKSAESPSTAAEVLSSATTTSLVASDDKYASPCGSEARRLWY